MPEVCPHVANHRIARFPSQSDRVRSWSPSSVSGLPHKLVAMDDAYIIKLQRMMQDNLILQSLNPFMKPGGRYAWNPKQEKDFVRKL
jgi:hypothetical protein